MKYNTSYKTLWLVISNVSRVEMTSVKSGYSVNDDLRTLNYLNCGKIFNGCIFINRFPKALNANNDLDRFNKLLSSYTELILPNTLISRNVSFQIQFYQGEVPTDSS